MVKDISSFLSFSKFLIKISLKLTGQLGHIFLINKVFSSFVYLEVDIKVNLDLEASEKLLILSLEEIPIILKFSDMPFISLFLSVKVLYKSSFKIILGL